MSPSHRLAITGMGALTPLGFGTAPLRRALREGRPPAPVPRAGDPPGGLLRLTGSPRDHIRRKGLAGLSRAAQLTAAALESLLGGGGPGTEVPPACGLVVGTAYGHLESKARFYEDARRDGVGFVSPLVFPNTIINSLAGHAAILFGLKGLNSTVTSGRLSGLEALIRAASLIGAGRARRLVVAAGDEISEPLLNALAAAGGGSGGPGASAEVPVGEGAAAVLLEVAENTRHGARPLRLELCGWGEATVVGRSLEDAAAAAFQGALARGGLEPAAVPWVVLSACGDPRLDTAEAAALGRVLGGALPACAPKAVLGETFGAAGLLGCLWAALGLEEEVVPATQAALGGRYPGLAPAARPAPPGPVLVSAADEGGAMAAVLRRL